MNLKVLYRISDGGNPKVKLQNATKEHCLDNCLAVFETENTTVFADNCSPETLQMLRNKGLKPIEIKLGNALSWRFVAEFAMQQFADNQAVYLLEDDYLHQPKSATALLEGLEIADYVTLYDHPDKYLDPQNGGMNPYVENGGEDTKVFLTPTCHWRRTNSTTMTFATTVQTLKEDKEIWLEFTSQGFPYDFGAFQRLAGLGEWQNRVFGKKRILISSIPGLSTHGETAWLSPFTDWETI